MPVIPRRPVLALGVAMILAAGPALAHHGWSWAVEEQTELTGTVREVSMNPPHPSLMVEDAEGTVWQVDLSNPGATARSGWTAESAAPGDAVWLIGNRSKDPEQRLMKAVQIRVRDVTYDIYPDRVRR
ncbi:DUF6152 family protein [Paracoccus pacificus]|uniref:DUF6152 family protein n=1 Tax=Paracoccus pacificus TaxID=1463598 RepID=A0ABW4R850_9RHOB